MFTKLMQTTVITLALYALLGLNILETKADAGKKVAPSEVIVALKQALTGRESATH